MNLPISEKIALLNQTTLDSLVEKNYFKIIEKFTETGVKILGADFGYAWWKTGKENGYQLVYRSFSMHYIPLPPRKRGTNYKAVKNNLPLFVNNPRKDIRMNMKSYVIVPISYNKLQYGSLAICFKKNKTFTEEDRGLALSLGNSTAQAITIHELVKSEQESRLIKERLEQEKIRTEFIADATHEIRTPLAIIRGNVDLANTASGDDSAKVRRANKAFKEINYEIEHLAQLLTDLSILTSQGEEIEKRIISKEIDLAKIITRSVARLKPISKKKGISIHAEQMSPILMRGDKVYLEKLFLNLIKNAITYGKENGWIEITAKRKSNSIQIEVRDNGIGISKVDTEKVFERFFKAETAGGGDQRRTGLGLAIAKWITEMHGGKISVKSVLGKGTSFFISLPISRG